MTTSTQSAEPNSRAAFRNAPLTFGLLNIRSIANKLDDLLEIRRDRLIDVLCLVETWHDADSATFRRLLKDGYQVVDRPRPRISSIGDSLTNHGGVALVAASGIGLVPVTVVDHLPTTFEITCCRLTSGRFSCVVVVIYRPDSAVVQSMFFDVLSAVFDGVATQQEPVFVVGDLNIHLDRCDDLHARQLNELVTSYGFAIRPTASTHQLGGTIDVVITRADSFGPDVSCVDVGLSDHFLLQWSVTAERPSSSTVEYVTQRPWRQLDVDDFRTALMDSVLCQPNVWPDDVDQLASLYDSTLCELLDRLIPYRQFTRRPRSSDPWFDRQCREAKRLTRRLERAYSAAVRRSAAKDTDTDVRAAEAAWRAQRIQYRNLRQHKRQTFWLTTIEADRGSPQKLWRSVDTLLGRGRPPVNSAINVETFNKFFADKVAAVRSATDGATEPSYTHIGVDSSLSSFVRLTPTDVITAINQLPDKSSAADPIPVPVLKQIAVQVAPFLAELFNRSLITGQFPGIYKSAFITPLIKKAGMDVSDCHSYRPISNLSVISKLLERLVARQLMEYLRSNDLLPTFQSAYRPFHSTETAVLRVLSDILKAVDSGDVAGLVLLDLSAAFDTVDHDILIRRLQITYGINGTAIQWFRSYLTDRSQYVRRGVVRSSSSRLVCGVPQGSVLGPILFVLYTADLIHLIERHSLRPHLYADDTQVYGSCSPADVSQLQARVTKCIDDIASWMQSNRLKLNTDKTEVLWCATNRRQHQLPTMPTRIGNDLIASSTSVRDLGIYLDADLSMRSHVHHTVSGCFAVLRQLRSIRRSVPASVYKTLVVSLVLTKLDYGNAVLSGLPAHLVRRLQSVMNAAARSIAGLRRSEHITATLASLHWLRASERIDFKVATLAYRCLHGIAPSYLSYDLRRVADIPSRRRLRSSTSNALDVPSTRLSSIGDRTFAVAASRLWNNLPPAVTSASSLPVFRRLLKTHLFKLSYPNCI